VIHEKNQRKSHNRRGAVCIEYSSIGNIIEDRIKELVARNSCTAGVNLTQGMPGQ
jgi:hypothetical protein